MSAGAIVDERDERRVVTVLFADVAGSTALGERIDPEELRVLQGQLFALVNAEVERFGGLSEKFVGDAVLAVFGVPLAHDDDAERAVRAALAVRDAFPRLARDVVRRHGVEIGLRIGVNTGEVVAGREAAARGELMVTGDAVNVGARLQQRAEPGQVLVGERTRTATRRAVDYASAGTAPAKGKREPLGAWEAIAVVAPPGARTAEGLSAPMIGRDEELVVLDALATRVERERAPQLVTTYGNAGVGKTRLVTEFVATLDAARVLHGRCLPYGEGITYWPLGEAAKGYAGILDSDPADEVLAKLEAAVVADVAVERVGGIVEALGWTIGLGLPEDEDRDLRALLRDAWRRFLTDLGRTGLAVLVVEDVHWASEPLLELLEHVTDTLVDTAVLTICTARPEFFDTRGSWGGGLRDSSSIRLSPLPEDESVRLVEALLGVDGLPRELTERIVARAEGNPFHVEEILQMLIDREAIARDGGLWSVRTEIGEVDLPDSVHGVLAARVDLLDPASRDALRRCSAMGRVFWPAAVGVADEPIAALARRGFVAEHASSTIEGMREFAFKHALTQDVVYASLPRAERRELHRQVGGWVEAMARGREAEIAEIAAYHYDQALEYGDASADTRERCLRLLLAAGGAALSRAAGEPARRLYGRAAELAAEPRDCARALIGLGRAELMLSGSRAADVLARARDEADRAGDRRLLADALGLLSRANWLAGRYGEAMQAATAALDALVGLDETPQLARAVARLSQLEMLSGLPQAHERAREALDVARRVGDEHAELNGARQPDRHPRQPRCRARPRRGARDRRAGGRDRRRSRGAPVLREHALGGAGVLSPRRARGHGGEPPHAARDRPGGGGPRPVLRAVVRRARRRAGRPVGGGGCGTGPAHVANRGDGLARAPRWDGPPSRRRRGGGGTARRASGSRARERRAAAASPDGVRRAALGGAHRRSGDAPRGRRCRSLAHRSRVGPAAGDRDPARDRRRARNGASRASGGGARR